MEENTTLKLLQAIQHKYGYDFSQYHLHYIEKELNKFVQLKNYQNIQEIPINQELLDVLFNHTSFFFVILMFF